MTTYGTIPASNSSPPNLEYISRAKECIKAGLGSRHPWKLMFHVHAIKLPSKFHEALKRIKFNVTYFRMNYAIMVLLVLFLSLLWHPVSLIVFTLTMAAWLFLYFLRDEPLLVFGRPIDDREVLIVLSVLTLVFLFLTHDVTANILVALSIGAVVVVVHAALRRTDDLFLDEESAALITPAAAAASSSS